MRKPERTITKMGGREISVAIAPRADNRSLPGEVIAAIVSLLRGMRITIKYFFKPTSVITEQYPENRLSLVMHERFRAQLKATIDDNGYHNCTGCGICGIACPNLSIVVVPRKKASGSGKEIDYLQWRLDTCTFCNACVIACPSDAIRFGPAFESAVYDRRLLAYNLVPYAGPPAKDLVKIENCDERNALMDPRIPYSGEVPMTGAVLPGVLPLVDTDAPAPVEEPEAEPCNC